MKKNIDYSKLSEEELKKEVEDLEETIKKMKSEIREKHKQVLDKLDESRKNIKEMIESKVVEQKKVNEDKKNIRNKIKKKFEEEGESTKNISDRYLDFFFKLSEIVRFDSMQQLPGIVEDLLNDQKTLKILENRNNKDQDSRVEIIKGKVQIMYDKWDPDALRLDPDSSQYKLFYAFRRFFIAILKDQKDVSFDELIKEISDCIKKFNMD